MASETSDCPSVRRPGSFSPWGSEPQEKSGTGCVTFLCEGGQGPLCTERQESKAGEKGTKGG